MFNFGPPTPVNVGAILASFEATRKRSRDEAEYTRKQQEDQIARQHLGPALAGDPNALQALFSASPERGMAVAKYLDGKASAELNRKLIEARIARLAAGPAGHGGGRGAVAGVPLPPEAEEEGGVPVPAVPAGMPTGAGPVAPGGMAGGIPGGPLPQRMPQATAALGGGPAPSPGAAPYGLSDPNAVPAPAMEAMPTGGPQIAPARPSPEQLAEAIAARRAAMAQGAPGGPMPGVEPAQANGGAGGTQRAGAPPDYGAAVAGGYRPATDGRGRPIVGPQGTVGMFPPGARSARDMVFVPMKPPKAAGLPEAGAPTGPQGKSVEAWALDTLLNGDPASPAYAAAFAHYGRGKVGPDGGIVTPDMRQFRPPMAAAPGGAAPPPAGSDTPTPGSRWNPETGQWVQAAPQAGPGPAPGTPTITEPAGGPKMSATERTKLRAMQVGAATLVKSLDDFAEAFEKADSSERLQTVAGMPTRLNTMWGLAAVLAKGEELMNLGVITGPDLGIIRRTVADPSTLAGAAADPKRVRQQVKAVTDLIKFRMAEFDRRSAPGGMSGAPAEPAPAATPAPDLRRKYNLE